MPDWLVALIVVVIVVLILALAVWWWMNHRAAPALAAAAPAVAVPSSPIPPGPYGPGSATPLANGAAPAGFAIKGNADSMLYHTPDSPYYGRTIAEVWFRTAEDAEKAGFKAYTR